MPFLYKDIRDIRDNGDMYPMSPVSLMSFVFKEHGHKFAIVYRSLALKYELSI